MRPISSNDSSDCVMRGGLQSLAIERCVHEIRGLLIAGNYARLLIQERAGPITPLQKKYLQVIVDNSRRIREVLSSLSWAADVDSWNAETFSVSDFLQDVALATGVRSSCIGTAANRAVCIHGDRARLFFALMALVEEYRPSSLGLAFEAKEIASACVTLVDVSVGSATHVHFQSSMSDLSRFDGVAGVDDARHILRIHGARVVTERDGAQKCSVSIEMPVAQLVSDGAVDA